MKNSNTGYLKVFRRSLTAVAISAVIGTSSLTYASNNDGSLVGQVLTTAKSPIANANVTIKNKETGFTRTVTADSDGNYRFGKLPVGSYSIVVSKDGYESKSLDKFSVRIGSNSANIPLVESGMETIEVRGNAIATIDVTSSESALTIGELELDRIPVPRTVTSVALLAPGTTLGDQRFGPAGNQGFASFGGSSVSENAMYINGLNVTNFRNGMGFSSVPFEFYKEFQVKTGGYSAEFGRSTGGVVNAVTKSGTNEFKFGGNLYYRPDSLQDDAPNSFEATGDVFRYNSKDSRDNIDGNIYASGPIIKDTLFFYAIYNPKSYEQEDVISRGSVFRDRSQDDSFWGAKIDWNITDDHKLEYLAFSDANDVIDKTYGYDFAARKKGNLISTATTESGGDNWSLKYTGYWTEDLTVSALYGENEYSITSLADNQGECEMMLDYRDAGPIFDAGCATLGGDYFVELGEDTREALRVDIEYFIGDHTIRAGFDSETNTSFSQQRYSGEGDGRYWRLRDAVAGTEVVDGVFVPDGIEWYARDRTRTVGGEFETEATALYIEDIWTATDNLTLTLGLRRETFDNKNSNGETFVKIDDMIAPRLGISWDVNGDGESKIFANAGRYFLPVANNTNVRLSGNEYDVQEYYVLNAPIYGNYGGSEYIVDLDLGEKFGTHVNADGSVPDTTIIVDQDLDPMYQDELIIGYQAMINEEWSWGARFIRRELNGAIDDMLIDHYTEAQFGCGHLNHAYVLGNPGEDMDVQLDTNCDGQGDGIFTIPGEALGYPKAERKYNSMVFELDREWDDVWSLSASYTWSHSYGNSEGLVKSDNAQDDAGITTDFDFVQLTDGAYGNLANDRRHMFKVFGAYAVTENLSLSANLSIQSGRPRNAFGVGHPTAGADGQGGPVDYGQTYYVCHANCATDPEFTYMPRGTYGTTDWVNKLDLAAQYNMDMDGYNMTFRVDIFNVLEGDSVTYYEEDAEEDLGVADGTFGVASTWQAPRYVQLSASIDF
ncbi:TonB-dependent receptor [Thalassotalea sp. G2M2-11]|uniref:TonB-dependent receptor n=1 Tax=Thalassotalea sp. G2M2-11 TaxID=2787627 RepID=UPI0019D2BB81|nr:TonB-dependent receptor [Thalassotalea sp. G2M2-11]